MFECIFQFVPQYFNPSTGNHWLQPGELNPYRVSYLNP